MAGCGPPRTVGEARTTVAASTSSLASSPISVRITLQGNDGNVFSHQGAGQVLDHFPGAAVHGNEGDQHLVAHLIGSPFLIGLEDEFGARIDHPVAGGDHVQVQCPQLLQMLADIAAERHHDLGKIALGRLIGMALVPEQRLALGQVRTEKVAVKKALCPRANRSAWFRANGPRARK